MMQANAKVSIVARVLFRTTKSRHSFKLKGEIILGGWRRRLKRLLWHARLPRWLLLEAAML